MKALSSLLAVLVVPAVLIADDPEKIDPTKGFGKAEWGMSVEEVLKAVPGSERYISDQRFPYEYYTDSLLLKGKDPIAATHYLFLDDQLICVVRLFDREILKQTSAFALKEALSEWIQKVEGIEVRLEGSDLWQKQSLARRGPQELSSNPFSEFLSLKISNLKFRDEIHKRLNEENSRRAKSAAEKLVPVLIAP